MKLTFSDPIQDAKTVWQWIKDHEGVLTIVVLFIITFLVLST